MSPRVSRPRRRHPAASHTAARADGGHASERGGAGRDRGRADGRRTARPATPVAACVERSSHRSSPAATPIRSGAGRNAPAPRSRSGGRASSCGRSGSSTSPCGTSPHRQPACRFGATSAAPTRSPRADGWPPYPLADRSPESLAEDVIRRRRPATRRLKVARSRPGLHAPSPGDRGGGCPQRPGWSSTGTAGARAPKRWRSFPTGATRHSPGSRTRSSRRTRRAAQRSGARAAIPWGSETRTHIATGASDAGDALDVLRPTSRHRASRRAARQALAAEREARLSAHLSGGERPPRATARRDRRDVRPRAPGRQPARPGAMLCSVGPAFRDGTAVAPETPGLGFELDWARPAVRLSGYATLRVEPPQLAAADLAGHGQRQLGHELDLPRHLEGARRVRTSSWSSARAGCLGRTGDGHDESLTTSPRTSSGVLIAAAIDTPRRISTRSHPGRSGNRCSR